MDKYISMLSKASSKSGELLLECINHYKVNGLCELTEKQLRDFCKLKDLI